MGDGVTVELSMFRDVRSDFDILRAASSILADKSIRFGTTMELHYSASFRSLLEMLLPNS